MCLETYPFRQHTLIIKKKKEKKKRKKQALSEAPFQTNRRLSLKKKERNTITYKRKRLFIHGTKETKKKKNQKP